MPGLPGEMLLGDSGYIENYPEYETITRARSRTHNAGPSVGENIIRIDRGLFWGYTGARGYRNNVRTIEGWKDDLREAYRREGGHPGPNDRFPRFTGRITFIDTAKVARKVFDDRNR